MPAAAEKTTSQESLGRRLRHERERRQISLSSIAKNTKIAATLFEDLERDDASRWPSGIFRRSFIKAYARAIGLDADAIAQEFLERFPDPNDPNAQISPEIGTPPAPHASLRLTLAVDNTAFTRDRLLATARDRVAAVTCDLAFAAVLGLVTYVLVGALWMPLCIAVACYYAGGVLLLGNTPGVRLCAPGDRRRGTTLRESGRAVAALVRRFLPRDRKAHHVHDAFEAAQLIRGRQRAKNA